VATRPVHLLLSALGWAGFNVVMLWAVAFLADAYLPRTVDSAQRVATAAAVATDLALLLLFAAQHSVMARRSVKAWLRRWVPVPLERTTYVLVTNGCLAVLFVFWQPFGGQVWQVHGVAAVALWILCGAGWALAVAATFAVDQLELTGLRQAGWGQPLKPGAGLEIGGMYAVVRHPLMTGLLLAFWATPSMGVSHLLFAAASTAYIALGVAFEERDLRRTYGAAYEAYATRVPSVVPGLRLWRARVGQEA
jgi:protein-S-isoprenylcysteine O-methyltransferase Ste14